MKKQSCECLLCSEKGCMCGPYASFFSTLGSATRLHIVSALRKGPMNVSAIVRATGLEQTCVSHCLRLLERYGFVSARREGKSMIYTLDTATVEPLMRLIDAHVREHCMDAQPGKAMRARRKAYA